jgi:REP element-mobilizing transposase RayT
MVAAYHLIWTAYGWWLPNDPRGSMSHEIRAAHIEGLGELHYGRRRILPAFRDLQKFYEEAGEQLKHPLLTFSEQEIVQLGQALGDVMTANRYTCYAAAVMPDHVHLVIRKHKHQAEEMIAAGQEASRLAVLARPQAGREPEHPVWGGPGWKVYLNSRAEIERVIGYVRMNPVKARWPRQSFGFVKEYDGWMPGLAAGPKIAKPQAENQRQRRGGA